MLALKLHQKRFPESINNMSLLSELRKSVRLTLEALYDALKRTQVVKYSSGHRRNASDERLSR